MNGNDFSFNDTACGIQYSAGWWFDEAPSCHTVCLTCERNFAGTEGHWLNYNWLIFANIKMMIRPLETYRPRNCYDIYKSADGLVKKDGVYNIYLGNTLSPLRVYCEMSKGGWTRILNKVDRVNGSFDKSWADYADGFGSLDGNSWLGLRNIQSLTNSQQNRLRIELSNDQSDRDFIEYDSFVIGSEKDDFKLDIGPRVYGTLEDSLAGHNKLKFSTFDKRNDGNSNCARKTGGGWWFRAMNGQCYTASMTAYDTQWVANPNGMNNNNVPNPRANIRMMIRPSN